MPYNIIIYFRLVYFHVSNCALFSTKYFSALILYRCSLDTFYSIKTPFNVSVPFLFHTNIHIVYFKTVRGHVDV